MIGLKELQIAIELTGSVFCIICLIFVLIGDSVSVYRRHTLCVFLALDSLQLFSDSMAWVFRGNPTTFGWFMVRISNYLVFILNFVMGSIVVRYVKYFMNNHNAKMKNRWKILVYGISGIGVSLITISQFTNYLYCYDEQNFYHRNDGFIVIALLAALLLVALIVLILTHRQYMRKIEYMPLLLVFLLPLIADIIQCFYYGISLANIFLMTGIIIMFMCYEVERSTRLVEQQKLLMENELIMARDQVQMADLKMDIMLSQIQPHFLFNAISTISFLCDRDPKLAKKTLNTFSRYLRMSMNSVKNKENIFFEKEMDCVNAYVAIEKMRFQSDLEIEFHLNEVEFLIPALTLQPLVENAIRHGVSCKRGGGKVVVTTERKEGYVEITVWDNGIGFDVEKRLKEVSGYSGLHNVKERLRIACNGSIEIQSTINEGTVVRMILPEEGKTGGENENTGS